MINRLTSSLTRLAAQTLLLTRLPLIRKAFVIGSTLFAAGTAIAQDLAAPLHQLAVGPLHENHTEAVRLPRVEETISPVARLPAAPTLGWLEPSAAASFDGAIAPAEWISTENMSAWEVYANLIFGFNASLTTGVEVTAWKTLYQETRAGIIPADQLFPSAPGEAVTIDWMVKYQF